MEDLKKIKTYRLIATLLLLLPLGITIWFLIMFAKSDASSFGLHIFTSGVIIFVILLQIFLLLKNMKKDIIIYYIAFNENKKVNKTALIFVSVGAGLGLALSITSTTLYFVLSEPQQKTTMLLLISIFVFMLINTGLFLLLTLMFRQKEFKVEDLLK